VNNEETKFKITQAPDTLRVRLEVWRKYGDKKDEWMSDESFNDMTVSELKALADYIYSKIKPKT
jgi:hypothetical protein